MAAASHSAPVETALVPETGLAELVGPGSATCRVALWDDYEAGRISPASVTLAVLDHRVGPARKRALGDFPNLRAVQVISTGYDYVEGFLPPGVALHNAASAIAETTAETGVLGILAALRCLPEHVRAADRGEWIDSGRGSTHPTTLSMVGLIGTTVLVIGQGAVGRGIAERLRPFRARVEVFARTARVDDDGNAVHAMSELDEWLPRAGVVALALPLSAQTEGLVDAAFLARLPAGAVVSNVGRGRVVVTDALTDEVRRGRLRAALDVVDPEPLPADHPLWRLPGVVLTPHTGAVSRAVREGLMPFVAEQVRAFTRGDDLRDLVGLAPRR